jgi:hypothetical protein
VDIFDTVRAIGLTFPDVVAETKYDGSPVLKAHGSFMAGIATHESAEADTLVVRTPIDDRHWLLEEAPDTYYLTEYYERHPVVLVRLERIHPDALRDLLSVSWRLASAKGRGPRARQPERRE